MSKTNIVPINSPSGSEEENPNRLSFTLEEMLEEFDNGQVPRSKYWKELITALYDTANHVVTGVTSVADVKPDNVGNIPLLPKDIDAPAMVRMDGADANNQQTNQDVFGRSLFYDNACLIRYQYDSYFQALPGKCSVRGVVFYFLGSHEMLVSDLPTNVWMDVCWPSDPMKERVPIVEFVFSLQDRYDYVKNGVPCYVEKIASIQNDKYVNDFRATCSSKRPVFSVNVFDKNSLDPRNNIQYIAHRGLSRIAPENTLPAYELAASKRYWGAECDIRLTLDGEWILMHDETVDRTTDGTGEVSKLSIEYIKTLDAGKWFSDYYTGTKVPTLEEFLKACAIHDITPVIEIKNGFYTDYQLSYCINKALSFFPDRRFVFISDTFSILNRLRDFDRHCCLQLVVGGYDNTIIDLALSLGNCWLDINHSSLADNNYYAFKNGVLFNTWTVNTTNDAMNAIRKGVRQITTDHLI